jgi:hypothetical protein
VKSVVIGAVSFLMSLRQVLRLPWCCGLFQSVGAPAVALAMGVAPLLILATWPSHRSRVRRMTCSMSPTSFALWPNTFCCTDLFVALCSHQIRAICLSFRLSASPSITDVVTSNVFQEASAEPKEVEADEAKDTGKADDDHDAEEETVSEC